MNFRSFHLFGQFLYSGNLPMTFCKHTTVPGNSSDRNESTDFGERKMTGIVRDCSWRVGQQTGSGAESLLAQGAPRVKSEGVSSPSRHQLGLQSQEDLRCVGTASRSGRRELPLLMPSPLSLRVCPQPLLCHVREEAGICEWDCEFHLPIDL